MDDRCSKLMIELQEKDAQVHIAIRLLSELYWICGSIVYGSFHELLSVRRGMHLCSGIINHEAECVFRNSWISNFTSPERFTRRQSCMATAGSCGSLGYRVSDLFRINRQQSSWFVAIFASIFVSNHRWRSVLAVLWLHLLQSLTSFCTSYPLVLPALS